MRPEVTFRKIGLAGRLKPAFERRRGTYGSNSSASGSGRGVTPEDRNCPQSPRRKLQPLAQTPLALSASTAPLSAAMKVARVTEHPEADRTPQRCSQCTAYSTLGSISLCVPVARAQGPARAGRRGGASGRPRTRTRTHRDIHSDTCIRHTVVYGIWTGPVPEAPSLVPCWCRAGRSDSGCMVSSALPLR